MGEILIDIIYGFPVRSFDSLISAFLLTVEALNYLYLNPCQRGPITANFIRLNHQYHLAVLVNRFSRRDFPPVCCTLFFYQVLRDNSVMGSRQSYTEMC